MKVEVRDTVSGFSFRLVDGARKTEWAGYTQIVILDNTAAATAYYVGSGYALLPMPATDLLRLIAVGEKLN